MAKTEGEDKEPDNIFELKRTAKRSVTELNQEELIGWVVERLNLIEEIMTSIITLRIEPKERKIFRDIIMNSNVVHYGAKLKILKNLGYPKSLIENLRTLSIIRNGFAHNVIGNINKFEITGGNGHPYTSKVTKLGAKMKVMKSDGIIDERDIGIYILEFLKVYNKTTVELEEERQKLWKEYQEKQKSQNL